MPHGRSVNRHPYVYYFTRDYGSLANYLSTVEEESSFLLAFEMCKNLFKSKNLAYKHMKTHGNAVLVSRERRMALSDMEPRCRRRGIESP